MAGLDEVSAPSPWWVYVLVSTRRARTYVGITTDVDRRLAEHNGESPGGAKSTRAGAPWEVGARYGPYPNRSEASVVEYKVKQLSGAERLRWVED